MNDRIPKYERAHLFRDRLASAMETNRVNQSQLARAISVDRSTISQILNGDGTRLPNAQLVGECATFLRVSTDWLLGLSEHPERTAEVLARSLTVTKAPRALIDEQIFDWHREAAGYKIRHVPAGLPDMLKTRDMLRWEYAPHLGRTSEQAIGASEDRLQWMRSMQSDYEIAFPVHELAAFASAEGYYSGLPLDVRRGQLERMLELHDQLFPTLRVFLYDARRVWSSPATVFGSILAVIYLGRHYLAFRDAPRIQDITRHFDWLVREAEISDRDIPDHIVGLLRHMR